ncbi:hypothetical protein Fot_21500 [Forsythia ovata]|uniref:Uncharacterized protein n=1 Tax=Forsythia ovata TaxID=205694 RepID=A0ABD1UV09_9LAMI
MTNVLENCGRKISPEKSSLKDEMKHLLQKVGTAVKKLRLHASASVQSISSALDLILRSIRSIPDKQIQVVRKAFYKYPPERRPLVQTTESWSVRIISSILLFKCSLLN